MLLKIEELSQLLQRLVIALEGDQKAVKSGPVAFSFSAAGVVRCAAQYFYGGGAFWAFLLAWLAFGGVRHGNWGTGDLFD